MTYDARELQQAFTEAELHADTSTLQVLLADDSESVWRGREMALTARVSQTWIEQADGWRLAGIQFSSLGDA